MGVKLKDNKERIVQRSIGFNFRQIEFFNDHPDFKPDVWCRKAVDDQIAEIDSKFLKQQWPSEN